MKNFTILLLICLIAIIRGEDFMDKFFDSLDITETDALNCLSKTGLTVEDIDRISDAADEDGWDSSELGTLGFKFGCTLGCLFDVQGLMVDNKFVSSQVHAFVDRLSLKNRITDHHHSIQKCIKDGNSQSEPCIGALTFITCIKEDIESKFLYKY